MRAPEIRDINGVSYQLRHMDPRTQFHVMRRLLPLQGALMEAWSAAGQEESLGGFSTAFLERISEVAARMPQADVDYVLDQTLACASISQGERWAPIMSRGQLMFADLTMSAMLRIAIEVIKLDATDFFTPWADASSSTQG